VKLRIEIRFDLEDIKDENHFESIAHVMVRNTDLHHKHILNGFARAVEKECWNNVHTKNMTVQIVEEK
jgi:hypothetical protein